jgi:hypothetical protein
MNKNAFVFYFSAAIFLRQVMPIRSTICMRSISQEQFAALDYRVMRCAFDSQNELGRLCDEVIYQNDMAARLQAAGFRHCFALAHCGQFSGSIWLDITLSL